MKILVVDDSKAMRMIVTRALKSTPSYSHATIVEACDGREALAAIGAERPDFVLSDWSMPEMTGIELLESLNSEGAGIPFGFVTSEPTPDMHDRAMAAGARFLVTKPFTSDVLERALAAA